MSFLLRVCLAGSLALALSAPLGAHADFYATVQNDLDGRCLEADIRVPPNARGGRVQMWDCNGSPQQLWHVETVGNVYAIFRNAYSGTCLDSSSIPAGSNASESALWEMLKPKSERYNGARVSLEPCTRESAFDPSNVALTYLWDWGANLPRGGQPGSAPMSRIVTALILDYDPTTRGNGGRVHLWTMLNPRPDTVIRDMADLPPQQRWRIR